MHVVGRRRRGGQGGRPPGWRKRVQARGCSPAEHAPAPGKDACGAHLDDSLFLSHCGCLHARLRLDCLRRCRLLAGGTEGHTHVFCGTVVTVVVAVAELFCLLLARLFHMYGSSFNAHLWLWRHLGW